jgi:hypothetical protein
MLGEDLEGDVPRILGPLLDSHLIHMAFHSQDNPIPFLVYDPLWAASFVHVVAHHWTRTPQLYHVFSCLNLIFFWVLV